MPKPTWILLLWLLAGCSPSSQEETPAETQTHGTAEQPTAAESESFPIASPPRLARPSASNPVVASAILKPSQVRPGDEVVLELLVSMAPGWHIHGTEPHPGVPFPTSLTVELPTELETMDEWEVPSPRAFFSAVGDGVGYEGEVTFRRLLRVAASASPGVVELACTVGYQPCDEHRCLRPETATVDVTLEVVSDER